MSPELKCGERILKLETDEPCESLRKKALLELRETPENIENGLNKLKRLLETETDLFLPITQEWWLMVFLRTCKFYPESARDLIKGYCNIRRKYSEITTCLYPKRLKHVFDAKLVSILPQRDQHGRRFILTLCGKAWNYKVIPCDDIFSSSTLCTELLKLEPETQISGIVYLLDLEGFTFGHALTFTPYILKRCADCLQNNIPLRFKALHIINQPRIFQPVMTIVKPFLTPKFAKRLHLHGYDYKSLHQHISPECLPKCYGGTLDCEQMYSKESYELVAEYEQYFEDLQKCGYKTSIN